MARWVDEARPAVLVVAQHVTVVAGEAHPRSNLGTRSADPKIPTRAGRVWRALRPHRHSATATLQHIAEHGRMAWQKASGYTGRARAETGMSRFKQVIGDGVRSHADERRATEVGVAVHVLNRVLEPGRPGSVRIA